MLVLKLFGEVLIDGWNVVVVAGIILRNMRRRAFGDDGGVGFTRSVVGVNVRGGIFRYGRRSIRVDLRSKNK